MAILPFQPKPYKKPEGPKYNGWTKYETWNVALWIDNDNYNYQLALMANATETDNNYEGFLKRLKNLSYSRSDVDYDYRNYTGDNVSLTNEKIDIEEIDELIQELRN